MFSIFYGHGIYISFLKKKTCEYLDIESFSIYFFPPQICNGGPRSSQKRYTLTLGCAVFFALNFFLRHV
jgi:hypothetical protein